jgi:hypothetical protein
MSQGGKVVPYVEQTVDIRDRDDPPAPVAVPISLWSSILMVATVELISSFQPMKNEAKKIRADERVIESGVLVAIASSCMVD